MADSCTSWVKFASKCFIQFDAIINGIVFLIELPGCPLLVYGNTADCFCRVLLPRALAEFISANSFCGVGILRISCSSLRMSMNNGAFTLRLSVWCFLCLTLLWLEPGALRWIATAETGVQGLFLFLPIILLGMVFMKAGHQVEAGSFESVS